MFDRVIMVDWSAANQQREAPKADAVWTAFARAGTSEEPRYHRNRADAEELLARNIENALAANERLLIGFDLCFAYPKGFASHLTGQEDPLALWDWFAEHVTDTPDSNNRFDVAGEVNARFPGIGPFWGNGLKRDIPHLPRKGRERSGHGMAEKRRTDLAAKGAFSPWQLAGAGAVGSQVIMAFPMLSRLRHRFAPNIAVWPFEPADAQIILAETYFSLLPNAVDAHPHPIKDAKQVATFAARFSALSHDDWATVLNHPSDIEGRILGLGHEVLLTPPLVPPPLQNDCFAMPQGAVWTPVDDAHAHLRQNLKTVVASTQRPVAGATNRILSVDAIAARSHPPKPNAAVDGYALKGPLSEGEHHLPLAVGRSAAGEPSSAPLPDGHALRILTGAILPEGADTVVLQEDISTDGTAIALNGPLRAGANARKAGEDMIAGAPVLSTGRKLTHADIGTLTAAGVENINCFNALRVGVLSTGDELRDPGHPVKDGHIYDANRPMLLSQVSAWGFAPIDLKRAPDNRDTLRTILDQAADQCDVILTSGGASAGDEDHMSALLQESGSLSLWRIAMKPGRPLALGLWQNTPVFGLPGNPVAALVCALTFAYPALHLLAGAGWRKPVRYKLPAGFAKSKKAGRREYLRARVEDGVIRVFASEGSGRISGLSWADGLVELPDEAVNVVEGDLVTYLPFAGFN